MNARRLLKIFFLIIFTTGIIIFSKVYYNSTAATASPENWMSNISGEVLLSDLSIPGTHNSGTSSVAGSWKTELFEKYAKCQSLTIKEQLNAGARYFDLRLEWDNKQLELAHGDEYKFDCKGGIDSSDLDLLTVLSWTLDFLESNTSKNETIIYEIKDETGNCAKKIYEFFDRIIMEGQASKYYNSGTIDGSEISNKFKSYLSGNFMQRVKQHIYLGTTMPKLKDARGKIIILGRLKTSDAAIADNQGIAYYSSVDKNYWAFNARDFPKGSNYTMECGYSNSKWQLWVQDYYDASSKDEKWKYVQGSLTGSQNATYRRDEARKSSQATLCVIFSSMNNISVKSVLAFSSISPKDAANTINPKITDLLDNNTSLYTGCLVVDYGTASIFKDIYNTNFQRYGKWSSVTYTWNGSKCTASRYMVNDPYTTQKETVQAYRVDISSLECESDEEYEYIAEFKENDFLTQKKTFTTQATGHNWGTPSYIWSDDLKIVTATVSCLNDSSHTQSEIVNVEKKCIDIKTNTYIYTAQFENTLFKTQQISQSDLVYDGNPQFSSKLLNEFKTYYDQKYTIGNSANYYSYDTIQNKLIIPGNYIIKYRLYDQNQNVVVEGKYNLTINKGIMSDKIISISNKEYLYDGYNKTVNINLGSVMYGKPNITYAENKNGPFSEQIPMFKEVGSYEIWYKLTADYYEDKMGSFILTIKPGKLSSDIITISDNNLIYNAKNQKAKITLHKTPDGKTPDILYSTDQNGIYSEVPPLIKDVGNYKIWYKLSAESYEDFIDSFDLVIYRGEISQDILEISDSSLIYNGKPQSATVDVKDLDDGSKADLKYSIFEDGPYDYEIPTRINVGETKIWCQITSLNYKTVITSFDFTIMPATMNVKEISYSGEYDGKPHTGKVKFVDNLIGNPDIYISYSDNIDGEYLSNEIYLKDVGTKKIFYKIIADNYKDTKGSFDVTINPRKMKVVGVDYSGEYDGKPHTGKVRFAEALIGSPDSYITYSDKIDGEYNTDIIYSTDIGIKEVYYKINAKNYEEYNGSFKINIFPSKIQIESKTAYYTYDNSYYTPIINIKNESIKNVKILYSMEEDGLYVEEPVSFKDAGEYDIWFKIIADGFEEYNDVYKLIIAKANIEYTKNDYVGDYDGEYHSFVLNILNCDNPIIEYLVNGEYVKEKPMFRDVGIYNVQYRIIDDKENYNEVIDSSNVEIYSTEEHTEPVEPNEEEYISLFIYRLYNPNTHEHLFTSKINEYNSLKTQGWVQEGITFDAYSQNNKPDDAIAIYRVYNPNANGGDHHYTAKIKEVEKLVKNGWIRDNGGEPLFYTSGNIAVYKLYETTTGRHHYTPKQDERNKLLNSGEWNWKIDGNTNDTIGVAWYVNAYYLSDGTKRTHQ